jgi:hypothetical protein
MDAHPPKETDTSDCLLDAMTEHWEHVVRIYGQFGDKHPIMLYDIQEERIYAYPYEDFKSEMPAKSQTSLTKQYEQAVAKGKMVVFVRDNEKGRLVSYLLDYE